MEKTTTSKKYRKVGPYLLLKQIGKGSYSTVYQATANHTTYAVKQISLEDLRDKQLERIHQELEVLSLIKHPNIVNLIDYQQTPRNLYLIFELCKFSDLDSYIKEHHAGRLPEEQARGILVQLKNAFIEIKKHKVVHRDLKLNNILVTQDLQIKLADFGFAKFEEQEYFSSFVGSTATMAPEVFNGKQYNQKCDIWSLGIITYQMLFGKNPFFEHKTSLTKKAILQCYKKTITFPYEIHPFAQNMISKMLVIEPRERMDFQEFFAHPWLKEKPQGELSEWLMGETLKQEVARSLIKSSKSPIEKEFILENCQVILAYSLIEFLRNYLENSLTTWLNLAKHLIDLQYPNSKLTFLALAVILQNVDQTMTSQRRVFLNAGPDIRLPNFLSFREVQTWPMSEYTKRLPRFVAKSRITINQFLKQQQKVVFTKQEGEIPLWNLFLNEVRKEIKGREWTASMRLLLKVRSWEGPDFSVSITSSVLSGHALGILTRKVPLHFEFNQLCRKCSSIFRLSVMKEASPLQLQLQKLRSVLLDESLE